jgi:hypothetical protein
MAERVDKQWKDKGLAGYSTAAIIGTLNHYGIALDEASLATEAADKSPLEVAGAWGRTWKGTGQFVTFPYAAANELFARLFPDRPTPMTVARTVLELIAQGLKVVAGQPGDLAAPFDAFEKAVPALPPVGERRDAFLREFVSFIEAYARPFNDLPTQLAKAGRGAEALRFAGVQETLFTDREGCVKALVRAALGERDAALAELTTWAGDAARDAFKRYSALDALYQLEAWDAVKTTGLAVFDAAATEERWALADSIAHLLAHMVKSSGAEPGFAKQVEQRLELAHHHSGGHHH